MTINSIDVPETSEQTVQEGQFESHNFECNFLNAFFKMEPPPSSARKKNQILKKFIQICFRDSRVLTVSNMIQKIKI